MTRTTRTRALARAATVAATALALTGAFVTTASAEAFAGKDVPTTATIAPGATGTAHWTYQNTGSAGVFPPSGSTVVFTAPGNSTFPAQSTVPTKYSTDNADWKDNNLGLRSCTLSEANTKLTCEGYGKNGGRSGWPANSYFRFSPKVTVVRSAPEGTRLTAGRGTVRYTDVNTRRVHTIDDGTLNVATSRAPKPMCLDAGNGRTNGKNVRIWSCNSSYANQKFVIDEGRIKVADTVGKNPELCVSTLNSRNNGDNVHMWECKNTAQAAANQRWAARGGQFVVENTLGTDNEMCLDTGNSRENDGNARIWRCMDTGNQKLVVQRGQIKVQDTL
ncbi:RICIN domain-containing protein [Streptomyces luteolus]|uniref:RICIN domain-containing protein n=1 Tax=Streptomyces luteolus TaxID=3043615 RepID=A0ABT6SZ67_9ACTN|nr:RICIN domain-containing protein [Streptomyces sp. B-S-A12]MDI3420898.1 RICIN domain-containing protein [Streptomyces sp. B-S-A12]